MFCLSLILVGIRILEVPSLVRRVADAQIPLTVCPLSNVCISGVNTMAHHPILNLRDAGLLVSINSDDPAYFGGYLLDNYRAVCDAFPQLRRSDMVHFARCSILSSFLSEREKQLHIQRLDEIDRCCRPSSITAADPSV